MLPIVLASSSPYRKSILEKLQLPFSCISPNVDESSLTEEPATDLVIRLAKDKASAIANTHTNHLIIGSDQVAVDESNKIITKPLTEENAVRQLQNFSGKTATFYTGLCLLNSYSKKPHIAMDTTTVKFKELSEQQIINYIRKEKPLDCAGSFKCEALGITLFESINSTDPNALIGLPLIKLVNLLAREGVDPLSL